MLSPPKAFPIARRVAGERGRAGASYCATAVIVEWQWGKEVGNEMVTKSTALPHKEAEERRESGERHSDTDRQRAGKQERCEEARLRSG